MLGVYCAQKYGKLIMSFVSGTTGNEAAQKFLEVLQSDFKNLGIETKKKYPQIKEVCTASP